MAANQGPVSLRTSVWWDLESCPVPSELEMHTIAGNIRRALACNGYQGTITYTAFGDGRKLSNALVEGFNCTGIRFHHVPSGTAVNSWKAIIVDMLLWALDHPPPSGILLVSGDKEFSAALHGLHLRKYTVLISSSARSSLPESLASAAERTFTWEEIMGITEDHQKTRSESSVAQAPNCQEHLRLHTDALELPRQLVAYTLETLRGDKLAPSDFNIQARLKYIINKFGLKDSQPAPANEYLAMAITAGDVVALLEDDRRIYLPRGEASCWPYVDPSFPCNVYSSKVWWALKVFLLSSTGREKLSNSKSRYHAAEILKLEGPVQLSDLAMGQLIHLVQLCVTFRCWLKPHPTKWTPVDVDRSTIEAHQEWSGTLMSMSEKDSRWNMSRSSVLTLPMMAEIVSRSGIPSVTPPTELAEIFPGSHERLPNSKRLATFHEFKDWILQRLRSSTINPDNVANTFEEDTGLFLDPRRLGFADVHQMIQALSSVPTPVGRKEMIKSWEAVLQHQVQGKMQKKEAPWSPAPATPPPSQSVSVPRNRTPATPPEGMSFRARLSPDAPSGHKEYLDLQRYLAKVLPLYPSGLSIPALLKGFESSNGYSLSPGGMGFPDMASAARSISDICRVETLPSGLQLIFSLSSTTSGRGQRCSHSSDDRHLRRDSGHSSVNTPQDRGHANNILSPSQERSIWRDLEALLKDVFKSETNRRLGYQLAFLKGDFVRKFGYPLDHDSLGFPKLKGLILEMPHIVHVTAAPGGHGLLFPAQRRSEGSWKKPEVNRLDGEPSDAEEDASPAASGRMLKIAVEHPETRGVSANNCQSMLEHCSQKTKELEPEDADTALPELEENSSASHDPVFSACICVEEEGASFDEESQTPSIESMDAGSGGGLGKQAGADTHNLSEGGCADVDETEGETTEVEAAVLASLKNDYCLFPSTTSKKSAQGVRARDSSGVSPRTCIVM